MPVAQPLPARQPGLREHNLALALGAVAALAPVSRAQVASATGLTKATVSSLVDTLVEAGLVADLGRAVVRSGAGRPGAALALAPGAPVGIGLEVNVDYVATCTVALTGAVRERHVLAGDLRGVPVPAALDRAADAVRRALDGARAAGLPVAGLAVAVPGLVHTGRGLLRLAPNLGWREVAVVDELRRRLPELAGLPVRLDNEANLAALAELWCAGHEGPDGAPLGTFVLVSGEIGIGAAVVVDGAVMRGQHGYAGELGHVPVPLPGRGAGRRCRCGATDCLEGVAGQEAVLRAAGLRPDGGPPLAADRLAQRPVLELAARAAAGDERALAAVASAGTALGVAVSALVNLLDVDTVVLGGFHARLAPWLTGPVEVELSRRVLAAAWQPVRVLASPLAGEAAVRGAATSVVRAVIADPALHLAGAAG